MSTTVMDQPTTPVPTETETETAPMRCSDALRRGARYHRQAQGAFYDQANRATCALGALVVGLLGAEPVERGTWADGHLHRLVLARTGVDLEREVFCPVSGRMLNIDSVIWTLNDIWGWTREQIADWLQSLGL